LLYSRLNSAVTAIILLFYLKIEGKQDRNSTFRDKIAQLDILGNVLFVGSIICLLLALQWGGVTYAWGSGRIIALFVLFGILVIAFVVVQIFKGETATGKERHITPQGDFSTLTTGCKFLLGLPNSGASLLAQFSPSSLAQPSSYLFTTSLITSRPSRAHPHCDPVSTFYR